MMHFMLVKVDEDASLRKMQKLHASR